MGQHVNFWCPRRLSSLGHTHILVLLLFLVQFSWQQKDPLQDFCRRFGQQSAVIDEKLYLDGGLVDWNPISQNLANYSNTFLLYNDLTSVSSGGEPQLYANLSKNGTIPDMVGGVLWADDINKRFYLFGGEYYQTPAVNFKLLSYDVINDHWDSFGPPSTAIVTPAWGAGVSISERGEGYYYGGWNSNATTPGYSGDPVAVASLIIYEMDSNSWTTNAGPDSIGRAEGVMVYIPASDRGLLIYFGGISQNNGTTAGFPMDTILIYDVASSKWYTQTASGDVPEMRRRFCAGATWASDRSSYNIYLYGGAGIAPNTTGFDDVYILSLPSFTWIKWFPTTPGLGNPHNSLTCNVVNGAQMLIIGGTFPLGTACDSPGVWGTHSLDLGKQNPDKAIWYNYRPNITSYVVPDEIISKVGGNSVGAAEVTAPATWLNRDLPVYFTRTASNAARTPTRIVTTSVPTSTSNSTSISSASSASSLSPVLSTGAIAGIAVGGVAVIVLIALGCFFCLRGRRRNGPALAPVSYTGDIGTEPYSPLQHTTSPYSSQYPQPLYPQQSHNMPELPENTHIPVYSMEPKYDSALTQAYRNGSIQENNPPNIEGVWAQRRPSEPSPQQSQHYYPSPNHSPPSTFTPVRAEPAELSASRAGMPAYSSPATNYTARRPVTAGSEQHHQYPQYS